MTVLSERYRVDLAGLQSACEINYVRLMQLLPDMRERRSSRSVALRQGEHLLGVLRLEVLEISPYTTTLVLQQAQLWPWLQSPRFEVRVYHDARMAEVVVAENRRRVRSLYPYPNEGMHQPDEKTQLNVFLGEWLAHSLACGHVLESHL